MTQVLGIHHVSSTVKHAQENMDFYLSVMNMDLVKQTLNFDDKLVYHLYFTNGGKAISTYFPMSDSKEGRIGDGQAGYVTYAIEKGSHQEWIKRLETYDIPYFEYKRFNQNRIAFQDPHGLELELVESELKGIESITLFSQKPEATVALFKDMFGYSIVDQDEELLRLQVRDDFIDIRKKTSANGSQGHGAIHHVALAIEDGSEQAWFDRLVDAGFTPTPIKDRHYFKAIYFREKGGILIELATQSPGVMKEEGDPGLIIPAHFEDYRQEILDTIMPLNTAKKEKLVSYGYRNKFEYDRINKRNEIKERIKQLKNEDPDNTAELEKLKKAFLEN